MPPLPFRAPEAQWPLRVGLPGFAEQARQDLNIQRAYMEVTRFRDRIDFLLGEDTNVVLGNNVWWEFSPVEYSVLFELKAHAKVAGVGNLALRLRINGVTYDTVTLPGGSTAVLSVTPANQLALTPSDKLGVDVTSVTGSWQWVTFTVVLEPRYLDTA